MPLYIKRSNERASSEPQCEEDNNQDDEARVFWGAWKSLRTTNYVVGDRHAKIAIVLPVRFSMGSFGHKSRFGISQGCKKSPF